MKTFLLHWIYKETSYYEQKVSVDTPFQAENIDHAVALARARLLNSHGAPHEAAEDIARSIAESIESVRIYEIGELRVAPVDAWGAELRSEAAKAAELLTEKAERAEYARLQKKFGGGE